MRALDIEYSDAFKMKVFFIIKGKTANSFKRFKMLSTLKSIYSSTEESI